MKSMVTRSMFGILSCFGVLTLAGCGAAPDDADEDVGSVASAVVSGEYARSYRSAGTSWYSMANASFKVPANPRQSSGQILYYYVGLWNSSSMTDGLTAQLRYANGAWTIRACRRLGTDCSTAQTVYPNDIIFAQMNETGCSATGVCDWVVFLEDWTHWANTSRSYSPGVALKYATPWAERVSNISSCGNLPNSSPISADSHLEKGSSHTPDAGTWSWTSMSGGTPACNPWVSIYPNPGTTNIYQSH